MSGAGEVLPAPGRRLIVGIGESVLSDRGDDAIVTHALGSCVAVCIWDPIARVGGMLHFLLPESRINPARAVQQPDAFADTGIPRLFQAACARGLQKARAAVKLVGGAESAGDGGGVLSVGRRNVLVARQLISSNGLLIQAESVGGTQARTVTFWVATGRLQITCGRERIEEL